MDPFLGEIRMVGFNFNPRDWAFCNGQLMSISQNSALFSLLGTTYGGDGQTTFALPDLRSRTPVHFGQGPGLPAVQIGESAGSPSVTLTQGQMPQHSHAATASVAIPASSADGSTDVPSTAAYLAKAVDSSGAVQPLTYGTVVPPPAETLAPFNSAVTVQPAGGNQPVDVTNPFLAVNFVMALSGIFPSRP
jgi:microcystin-dependent protein